MSLTIEQLVRRQISFTDAQPSDWYLAGHDPYHTKKVDPISVNYRPAQWTNDFVFGRSFRPTKIVRWVDIPHGEPSADINVYFDRPNNRFWATDSVGGTEFWYRNLGSVEWSKSWNVDRPVAAQPTSYSGRENDTRILLDMMTRQTRLIESTKAEIATTAAETYRGTHGHYPCRDFEPFLDALGFDYNDLVVEVSFNGTATIPMEDFPNDDSCIDYSNISNYVTYIDVEPQGLSIK